MGTTTIATTIIVTVLFIILASLAFGLFYLLRDTSGTGRTATALSVRVGLSMMLFLCLLLAIHEGWIIPNPLPL